MTTPYDVDILYNTPYSPSVIYKKMVELNLPFTDRILIILAIKIAVSFLIRGSFYDIYQFIANNSHWISEVIKNDFVYYNPNNTIVDNCRLRWFVNCFKNRSEIENRVQMIQKWNTYVESIHLGNQVEKCFPLMNYENQYIHYMHICNELLTGTFCLIIV
jgi:hypothetical protein